jgi:hypothetical protein
MGRKMSIHLGLDYVTRRREGGKWGVGIRDWRLEN